MPGIPLTVVRIGYKDTVHLHAIGVFRVACSRGKVPVDKYPEYPLMHRVRFLATVLFPQFLCPGKIIAFQFMGLGCHRGLSLYPSNPVTLSF
jgi:hypothetical protein